MKDLNGNFVWHYVNNENKVKGVYGDIKYLVCFEEMTDRGSIWHMQFAYWFTQGDTFTIVDSNGTHHKFDISKDGFYAVNEFSDGKGRMFFRIPGVRYWTSIQEPEVNPDDVLTIL